MAGEFEMLYEMVTVKALERQHQAITGGKESYLDLNVQSDDLVQLFYDQIFGSDAEKFSVTDQSYGYIETSSTDYDLNQPVVYLPRHIKVENYQDWDRYIYLSHGFDTTVKAYWAMSNDGSGVCYDYYLNFEPGYTWPLMVIGGMNVQTRTPQENEGMYISWYRVEAI